jgi:hypothetical protein
LGVVAESLVLMYTLGAAAVDEASRMVFIRAINLVH